MKWTRECDRKSPSIRLFLAARSTGPAIFAGRACGDRLWFFLLAPVSGAVVAGLVGGALFRKPEDGRERSGHTIDRRAVALARAPRATPSNSKDASGKR